MQIPPTSSLLQALSNNSSSVSPQAARVSRPNNTQAARDAARTVFAQLKTPVPGTPAPATPGQSQADTPSLPTQAPRRPMPRGSIINLLV